MNSIVKEIGIDAAHRVPLHQSKCKNLHGHRYTIYAELSGDLFTEGPQTDMVLDYGFMKDLLMTHIDAPCDHGIILSLTDTKFVGMAYDDRLYTQGIYCDWEKEISRAVESDGFWSGQTKYGKTYIIAGIPTAENLAKHWFDVLEKPFAAATHGQAKLSAITVKETPTSIATYRPAV